LIPLVFVALAELLAAAIIPYLAQDWEVGRRELVAARLRLSLKLGGLALTAGGGLLLAVAPTLFQVAWNGKFALGLHVLPWTMAACAWTALALLAQNYLWCAEKARLGVVPLFAGLACSVGLNWLLLPNLGLPGMALATALARLAALAALYALLGRSGMRFDRGTLLLSGCPVVLTAGPWVTGLALVVLAAVAATSAYLLTADEMAMLRAAARTCRERWLPRRRHAPLPG
jgi:PST family polysaccharide transporter/stage V sporulation protein B